MTSPITVSWRICRVTPFQIDAYDDTIKTREGFMAAIVRRTHRYLIRDCNHDDASATEGCNLFQSLQLQQFSLEQLEAFYIAAYTPYAADVLLAAKLSPQCTLSTANSQKSPTNYLIKLPFRRDHLQKSPTLLEVFSYPAKSRAQHALDNPLVSSENVI